MALAAVRKLLSGWDGGGGRVGHATALSRRRWRGNVGKVLAGRHQQGERMVLAGWQQQGDRGGIGRTMEFAGWRRHDVHTVLPATSQHNQHPPNSKPPMLQQRQQCPHGGRVGERQQIVGLPTWMCYTWLREAQTMVCAKHEPVTLQVGWSHYLCF